MYREPPNPYDTYDGEIPFWDARAAEDEDAARELFRLVHPPKNGFLPCCTVYPEAGFNRTRMWKDGNFGAFCHERIKLEVKRYHK